VTEGKKNANVIALKKTKTKEGAQPLEPSGCRIGWEKKKKKRER